MGERPGRDGLLRWLGRSAASRLLTALLVVGVVAVLAWWFSLPVGARDEAIHAAKMVVLWVLIAAALPWGLFFVPPLVARRASNLAAAAMLAGYAAIDGTAAAGLMGWRVAGVEAWGVLLLGLLVSLVYNFLVCEYLVRKAED